MKNLATCKPSEFLRQTVKIKKAVEKWLKITDILNIRKDMPDLPEDMPAEEKRKIRFEQAQKNVGKMFDAVMEDHPDETLELLALCCFVEPEDVDNYEVSEYLAAFTELLNNEAVLSFFTSLVQLGQTNIFGA